MSLWLVRAGRHGEQEQTALDRNLVTIGWNELPDLSRMKDREALWALFQKVYPSYSKNRTANEVGQVWAFADRIKKGDLVVLPLKTRSALAFGEVTGPYAYRRDIGSDVHHVRSVNWLTTDLPRTKFDQDLLYSFGAFMTVCQIKRNNAEERVRAILSGKLAEEGETGGAEQVDLERAGLDQISRFINEKFKGHDLARLVEAVLSAQGYVTQASEPGPDGGVDILAGAGPMGFENPKLCVQVKSSKSPADVLVLRNLQGVMNNFGATQGLLVAWGGFKRSTLEEARRSFFAIRLWDQDRLVRAILDNYERLPADVQAELPLKRVWTMVLEED